MSVFDKVRIEANAILSDWIQVVDPKSNWTIEDFPYATGVDENITNPHCWKCVSVNQCWFKNEEGKKPEEFDYSNFSLAQIPLLKRGLYHPNCHDKLNGITPHKKDFHAIIEEGKIEWLFENKTGLINAWGFRTEEEKSLLIEQIKKLSEEAFYYGRYKIRKHDYSGINISIFITISGINEKEGHKYNRISSYMVFTNGKLKNNTPISGRWDNENL